VDDAVANLVAAPLLFLEAADPGKDVSVYIDSPGGSAYAGMAMDVDQVLATSTATGS